MLRSAWSWCLTIAMVFGCNLALAIDMSQCGYLQCEAAIASNQYSCQDFIAIGGSCKCEPYGGAGHLRIMLTDGRGGGPYPYGDFAPCNCAAQPPISGGTAFAGGGAHGECVSGCKYIPAAPQVCSGSPHAPGSPPGPTVCPGDIHADGSNCDPLNDDPPPPSDAPPSTPSCDDTGDCLSQNNDNPPKLCGQFNGATVCVDPDNGPCGGNNAAGYLCAGPTDPGPPNPPPPPSTKPDPTNPTQPAPPDWTARGDNCTGSGCVPITINHYQGCPDPTACQPPNTCPPGSTLNGVGACVTIGRSCPDGSPPINGQCSAQQTCPDGSVPVNGRCQAAWSPCPNGQPPVAGQCAPANGLCPNGQPPANGGNMCTVQLTCVGGGTPDANGTCPASYGNCPNGSPPSATGTCAVGAPCDPATDPHQCTGDQGNAGGGQTCGAAPYCTGNPVECQLLYQEWQVRCTLHVDLAGTRAPTDADNGPTFTADQVVVTDSVDHSGDLNSAGWLGGGGQCPALPSVTFMDHTYSMADWIPCSIMRIIGIMVLLGAYVQAAYILGRR